MTRSDPSPSGADAVGVRHPSRPPQRTTARRPRRLGPHRDDIFTDIVERSWDPEQRAFVSGPADGDETPEVGDLRAGLTRLGKRYAALLCRPEMVDLLRIVIAETPGFAELSRAHFNVGKLPFYDSVRAHLDHEHRAGNACIDDLDTATTQFLGMVSNFDACGNRWAQCRSGSPSGARRRNPSMRTATIRLL